MSDKRSDEFGVRSNATKKGNLSRLKLVSDFFDSAIGKKVVNQLSKDEDDDLAGEGTVSKSAVESILSNPDNSEVDFEYVPAVEEFYNSILLRINAYDLMDYVLATEIDEGLETIFVFFDNTMPEYHASRLQASFGEIMSGTTIVQKADENDPEKPWVFVCTERSLDLGDEEPEIGDSDA